MEKDKSWVHILHITLKEINLKKQIYKYPRKKLGELFYDFGLLPELKIQLLGKECFKNLITIFPQTF